MGQTYRLDWFQGYGGQGSSGGSAIMAQLREPGSGVTKNISPLELANSPFLTSRSSDVFVATSDTYDLIIQDSDEIRPGYDFREALVDQFEFVAVNEPVTTRTSHSARLGLTTASNLEIDGLIGGASLEADIASSLSGDLNIEFDMVNGKVANLHFNQSNFLLDSTIAGVFELGVLGSADVTVTNGELNLLHEQSSLFGQHRTAVDEDGQFLLGGTFVGYKGLGELGLNGPINTILGQDSLVFDFEDLADADLGITTVDSTRIFSGPGSIDLLPTSNPSEFVATIGMPVLIATTVNSELDFEIEISGFIEAQGIVVVPEPSGLALALMAMAFVGVSTVLRRRQFGVSGD